MKILVIIIILSLISGLATSFDAIGYSGGRLIVINSEKYICKSVENDCKSVLYSNIRDDAGYAGKIAFYVDSRGYFTMLIRDMDLQDAGIYSFGTGNEWYSEMNLRVLNDSCCTKSERVTGYSKGNVVIRCDYPEEHREILYKYLYKQKDQRLERVIYSNSYEKNYKKDRFYITDDTHSNVFTISISNVNGEDGGVYYCGVETGGYFPIYSIATIKTIYLHVTERVASVRVSGVLGGRIMMECKHPEENLKAKFICKESQTECSEKTYSWMQNQWEEIGGFTVLDGTSRGSLMVFFRNVSEGTYRCGVDVSEFTEKYIEVTMGVMEDPCCKRMISRVGRIGETIEVICQHPSTYRSEPKHFCKENNDHICQDISSLRSAGKYSLSKSNQAGLFTVSVFNLTLSDAGVYWCGVETSEGNIRYTSLITKMQISIESGTATIGYEGDVVEISCPYSSNYKQHLKHFCKGNEEEECFTEQSNLPSQTQLQNKVKRFSLNNNITTRVFTVTIRGLTAEDAGKYWCAVRTGDVLMKYLSTELKVIMKQELHVVGHEALSVSINCSSSRRPHSEKNNGKSFCMGQNLSSCDQDGVKVSSERIRSGRFSLSDDPSSVVFTVTITDLRVEDSGMYWCREDSSGSTIYIKVHLQVAKDFSAIIIITGSVSVVLLLIGGLTLIFYIMRGKKTQGSSSSNSIDPTHNEGDLSAAHDYEEISHTTPHSRRNASSPNNRSNRKDTGVCIYSTVQLLKDEGLTYATVSFQKNPDSPSDGTVTVMKDDTATEYATIKHHSRRK